MHPAIPGPVARYRCDAAEHGYVPDDAQLAVAHLLEDRFRRIVANEHRRFKWRLRAMAQIRGLYLYGGVGRGKTYLMDLFCDALPIHHKRRMHFHEFMRLIQDSLAAMGACRNPLQRVARDLARSARVLCLDECVVHDIGDAMLLGGLLRGLIQRGVVFITTSNFAPWELYAHGLQRARFLPAIALLEAHCEVHRIGDGSDYRLRTLQHSSVFFTPCDAAARRALEHLFVRCSEGRDSGRRHLVILNRLIQVHREGGPVCWFAFRDLCGGPRNTADYMEIASLYSTVLVSDVPVLDTQREDEARRFINLIDAFYDRRVRLIVSAQAAVADLYRGDRLRFEFQRCASRLMEMRSIQYLSCVRAWPGRVTYGAADSGLESSSQGM